ncbi:hypothetical protein ACSBR2_012307 [Camellia fascicularis]
MVMGYLMFVTRSPECLMKIVEGKQYKKGTIQTKSSLFYLRQLQRLNLVFNHVRFSRISSKFGSFMNLTNLNLSNSLFSNYIRNMSQLAFLDLSGNQLTGPIPSYAIGFSRLAYLDLKNNSLNGTIPSWLFTLPSLVSIELRDNTLQGQIPVELDKLLKPKYLSHLDLSHNGLSLSINNKIGGEVPKWVLDVGKNSLKDLDLSNNFLTGLEKLPWPTLQFIDMHSNLLHGPLPIPPITTIDFSISNNKLTGEILPLICNLNSLKVLDLSNNNFSGIIRHCLENFSNSFSVLNLGMNSFH